MMPTVLKLASYAPARLVVGMMTHAHHWFSALILFVIANIFADGDSDQNDFPEQSRFYFVFTGGEPFCEGAAATVFGFSFFGFFASRLPFCSPFAITIAPVKI